MAEEHNVDAITLEGDRVSRKNVFKGGYIDSRSNRIALQADVRRFGDEQEKLRAKHTDAAGSVAKAEQQVMLFVSCCFGLCC